MFYPHEFFSFQLLSMAKDSYCSSGSDDINGLVEWEDSIRYQGIFKLPKVGLDR